MDKKILSGGGRSPRVIRLTHREAQLLTLLTNGLKNKEAAYALGITESTVKGHLYRLYQKVGVKDRFEMALFGLKNHPSGKLPSRLAVVARKSGS